VRAAFARLAGHGGQGEERRIRAIYFFLLEPGRIYMAGIYAKSRKETLPAADRSQCHGQSRGADQEGRKRRDIIMGVRISNTKSKKRTKFGLELEQSGKEILAHVKGEVTLPVRRIVLPGDIDVKRIRTSAGMSQAEFARAFCINPRTLQEWEQGRRKPDATTRAYLAVIAKNRGAVLEALAS
jgi:putative transcriptional regulator